jgi:single-strand DNA-binding protein
MSNFKAYGRIVKDIEISYVGTNNTAVARSTIAVDRGQKDKDGKSISDFHSFQAWNKRAELLEKYAKKGDRIVIEGDVQNNNYEDKNGTKHYGYVINVTNINFVETKKDRQEQGKSTDNIPKPEPKRQTAQQPQTNTEDDFMDVPDDIDSGLPFFD